MKRNKRRRGRKGMINVSRRGSSHKWVRYILMGWDPMGAYGGGGLYVVFLRFSKGK